MKLGLSHLPVCGFCVLYPTCRKVNMLMPPKQHNLLSWAGFNQEKKQEG